MALPRVEVEQVLPADPAHVYQVLRDMERFPDFMKSVESITVRERGDDYTVTEWVARLQGARFRWVERDTFLPERIVYRQVEGDLKTFEGEWRLEPDGNGTRVTLVTDFEFGIPMLSQLLNPVAKVAIRENARAMLDAIARQVG
jgi:coenzyme Q-binding protein COQ10